jgi:hypothetical protein
MGPSRRATWPRTELRGQVTHRPPCAESEGRMGRSGRRPAASRAAPSGGILKLSTGAWHRTQRPSGARFPGLTGGPHTADFLGALDAFPPPITLPERTDSHPTTVFDRPLAPGPVRTETVLPSGPGATKGEPPARAATEANGTAAPGRGVPGGRPPAKKCEPWRKRPKGAEESATPGGYGGKPPGVAIIGVPTGARNAGRCSDGGPEHQFGCYYETHLGASNRDTKRVQETVRDRCCSTQRERRWRSNREQRLRGCLEFHSWPGPVG